MNVSEYQYYEFAVVDRLLTAQEQAELRSRSTRATITASSFVNVYHWGNLKGDSLEWMERYFEAHVYSADWGSCRLFLRIPANVVDANALHDYLATPSGNTRAAYGSAFDVIPMDQQVILCWSFDDDAGEHARFWEQEDGPGWMARLLPLRDEILSGDTRPLYLGWLARLCNGALDPDDREPPLPAGLKTLTPAQAWLVEFLMVDPDWLAAAAEVSPPLPEVKYEEGRFEPWLLELTEAEMRAALHDLLIGPAYDVERSLRARFLKWERVRSPAGATVVARRTVAEIDSRRDTVRTVRLRQEQEARDAGEARRLAERERYLDSLVEREGTIWMRIDKALQRGTGHAYDEAFELLKDLAEAFARIKQDTEFRRGLVRLMVQHGKRGAWVSRLTKGGFMWMPKT
jgi:hypothetical protein